jgi:hypothetical protein
VLIEMKKAFGMWDSVMAEVPKIKLLVKELLFRTK